MNDAASGAACAPLITWCGAVLPAWVDYNDHINDGYYMVVFGPATDGLRALLGLDSAGRKATGHSIFTLESHINYLIEVKRLHIYHGLHVVGTEPLLAANEQMLLNVDMAGPRAAPFASVVAPRVAVLAEQHSRLPKPNYTDRTIALPARNAE